jgi:N-acetyltransferase
MRELVKIVNADLGAVPLSDEKLDECKVFIYVTGKNKAIGCIVAEPREHAFALLSASDVVADGTQKDLGTADAPLMCSEIATKTTCGVSRMWVVKKQRRHGVCAEMLDAVCAHFRYPARIPKQHIAFSQPTTDGKRFAERYTGSCSFLVYAEE